jgi:hypothetical protein
MERFINRYYENGDALIKVLGIIKTDLDDMFVCLKYSYNHNVFNIETYLKNDFLDWFEANELNDGDVIMPLVPASDIY